MADRTSDKDRMSTEMAEPPVARGKRTWLLVAAGLVVLALAAWFTGAIGSRRPVTILRDNAAFENPVARLLSKLPSGPRDSLRKLKFKLFGPPRMVSLDAKILSFYGVPPSLVDTPMDLGRPAYTGDNGLQIWIVPNRQVGTNSIPTSGQIISSPTAVTFSGHQAQTAIMAGPSGYTIDLLPRVRNEVTDLSVRVQHFDRRATNTLVAARFNLPKDCGAIVLKQTSTNPTHTIGIFLKPALLQIKK